MDSVEDSLWSRIDQGPGCWVWPGAKRKGGYGAIWRNGRGMSTHRLAYELTYGPIPAGLLVLHRCDNPPCCRPDHLFLGDTATNVADAIAKGRHVNPPNRWI